MAATRPVVFVGRAALDAAMAWAPRRIQGCGRRAKLDPRGFVFQRRGIQWRWCSWVEQRSTRRWLGHLGESRDAGVERSSTHGGLFSAPRHPMAMVFVGRASLDAAMAWAPRRVQGRGRRAKLDPRGLFSAPGHPMAMVFVGRARLDAAMAWAPRRIQEHGRRAERSTTLLAASTCAANPTRAKHPHGAAYRASASLTIFCASRTISSRCAALRKLSAYSL